jgi:DnaA-homolog protein
MTQLLLNLTQLPSFTFDSLIVHAGIEQAVSTIQSVYRQAQHQLPPLFLFGPEGTGKTHILHAAAALVASSHGRGSRSVKSIEASTKSDGAASIGDLLALPDEQAADVCCVTVDDVRPMSPEESAAIWSLYNQSTRWGIPLMMASREAATKLFQDNPHLTSRVAAGLVFRLEPPEDTVRMLIMDKLAGDRRVRISRDVCHYLVTRKSRNVNELERLVDILDRTSLELHRRITLPLIKMLEREGVI